MPCTSPKTMMLLDILIYLSISMQNSNIKLNRVLFSEPDALIIIKIVIYLI